MFFKLIVRTTGFNGFYNAVVRGYMCEASTTSLDEALAEGSDISTLIDAFGDAPDATALKFSSLAGCASLFGARAADRERVGLPISRLEKRAGSAP